MTKIGRWVAAGILTASLALTGIVPVRAADILQCVPYARAVSGLAIYGDAWTWWDQAAGHYDRGHRPKKGAVLAFQAYGPMQLGHVAVVSKILSDRAVLIRHANWSVPGAIEEDVLAVDVSDDGDWSRVRVWHTPTGQMGARANPTFGFIYPKKMQLAPYAGSAGERLETPEVEEQRARYAAYAAPEQGERSIRRADESARPTRSARAKPVSASARDDLFIVEYADGGPRRRTVSYQSGSERTLGDIIADVKREARLR